MENVNEEMSYYKSKIKNEKFEKIREKIDSREIRDVISSIKELSNKANIVNNQISESVFKAYFADMFINNDFINPKNHTAIFIKWLELTNSPYDEVDVVDDVTKELLFTVPPIFSRIITKADGPDVDLPRLINTAGQKEKWFPGTGEAIIRETIDKDKEHKIFGYDNNAMEIYAKRWREIINRYMPKSDDNDNVFEDLVDKDTKSEINVELSNGLDYD